MQTAISSDPVNCTSMEGGKPAGEKTDRTYTYTRVKTTPLDPPHNSRGSRTNGDASTLINSNRRASTMLHRAEMYNALSARAMTKHFESMYPFVSREFFTARRGNALRR